MFELFVAESGAPAQANGEVPEKSPVPSNSSESLQPSNPSEEADFFKQSADSGANKKMTKESIMSLFATSNPAHANQQTFGMPGTVLPFLVHNCLSCVLITKRIAEKQGTNVCCNGCT